MVDFSGEVKSCRALISVKWRKYFIVIHNADFMMSRAGKSNRGAVGHVEPAGAGMNLRAPGDAVSGISPFGRPGRVAPSPRPTFGPIGKGAGAVELVFHDAKNKFGILENRPGGAGY